MTEWRTFKLTEKDFTDTDNYNEYMDNCRCALCHKKLEIGDEFDIRPGFREPYRKRRKQDRVERQ